MNTKFFSLLAYLLIFTIPLHAQDSIIPISGQILVPRSALGPNTPNPETVLPSRIKISTSNPSTNKPSQTFKGTVHYQGPGPNNDLIFRYSVMAYVGQTKLRLQATLPNGKRLFMMPEESQVPATLSSSFNNSTAWSGVSFVKLGLLKDPVFKEAQSGYLIDVAPQNNPPRTFRAVVVAAIPEPAKVKTPTVTCPTFTMRQQQVREVLQEHKQELESLRGLLRHDWHHYRDLVHSLVLSPQFLQVTSSSCGSTSPPPSNELFTKKIYWKLLGRAVSKEELTKLAGPGAFRSRSEIAAEVLSSEEYAQATVAKLVNYFWDNQKPPAEDQLNSWKSLLHQHSNIGVVPVQGAYKKVVEEIAGGEVYRHRVLAAGGSADYNHRQYVTSFFQDVTFSCPTTGQVDEMINQVEAADPDAFVALARRVLNTPEAELGFMAKLYTELLEQGGGCGTKLW